MAHIEIDTFSMTLRREALFYVFIPTPGPAEPADGADGPFRTLYLLHDWYGGAEDWFLNTAMERFAQERRIALVMPFGEDSMYLDMKYGDAFASYIAKELPNVLCGAFPLSARREDTLIAGVGMGGYGAIRLALENPWRFGTAISLSGPLVKRMRELPPGVPALTANQLQCMFGETGDFGDGIEDLYAVLEKAAKAPEPPALYHVYGEDEDVAEANRRFGALAAQRGLPSRGLASPGRMDWDSRERTLRAILEA